MMQTIADLRQRFAQQGTVEWIGIAREPHRDIEVVEFVEVEMKTGIVGEHHANRGNSKRQVTLIQAEHLEAVGSMLGGEPVSPESVRRNIVVRGINLLTLKDAEFQIGEVTLKGSGPCVPCSRMEWNLGQGGYSAMRGHGGINTIVVSPGVVRVGDLVRPLTKTSAS